jgi:C1A family cysteine protease
MADGICHIEDAEHVSPIKSWAKVTPRSERALKHALLTSGPISVALDASHRSLSFYKSGVYYEPECKFGIEDLDHAVLLVGFGSIHGEDYWIVKNSWSEYWGDQGYFLMSFRNDCGITTQPTYAVASAAEDVHRAHSNEEFLTAIM